MQQEANKYDTLYTWSQRTLKSCQDDNSSLNKQKSALKDELNEINLELTASKENNTQMRKQLQDLATISHAQAESIKKSLDNMGARDTYLQDLQSALAQRNDANLAVVMTLKAALNGVASQDVSFRIDKGTVSIDLSDRLLFSNDSNSYMLTDKGKPVLRRIARVLNDQPALQFMVEGHTDSVSFMQGELLDNWDLSVKRATAVVRILQEQYGLEPSHIIAAGRSEYLPITTNDTPEGRAINRRTRIIILPQLDQFFKLLEKNPGLLLFHSHPLGRGKYILTIVR